jgi:hypothetical protein
MEMSRLEQECLQSDIGNYSNERLPIELQANVNGIASNVCN